MKTILTTLALLFLGASPARAETSFSRLLAHVQSAYLGSAATYPILILDRDDLEWRFVRAGATSDSSSARRIAVVQEYVKEKTGVSISTNAASNFEPYLSLLNDAAVAMPALKDGTDQPEIEMCAVFPPDPNRNQRLEMERILQLRTAEAYGTHEFSQLRLTMSYHDAVLFSVLHESGHCMDTTFFPQLIAGASDPATIHQSESFAEAIAVLLMAKEGRGNVAEARSYLRDMYSFYLEPFFLAHPEFGFGSESFAYGGLIYHLSPSIRAAAAELAARPGVIQSLPLSEVLNLAREVVEKNAFPTRLMGALYSGYTEGHSATLSRYKEFEAQVPEFFGGIVERLEAYWQADSDFKTNALLPTAPPAPSPTALLPFDQPRACASLAEGNYDAVRNQIDILRDDLRSGTPSYEAQTQRFALLSDLWKKLPFLCNGGRVAVSHFQSKAMRPVPLIDALVPNRTH